MSKTSLVSLIQSQKAKITSFGVEALYLYGSASRDELHENSDLDFIVDFKKNKKNFDNYMDLRFFLEDIGQRNVDLVTKNSLNPKTAPTILNSLQRVI
jgi:hypothetical protein